MKNFIEVINSSKGTKTDKAQDFFIDITSKLQLEIDTIPSKIKELEVREKHEEKTLLKQATTHFEAVLSNFNSTVNEIIEAQVGLEKYNETNKFTEQIKKAQERLEAVKAARALFPEKVEDVVVEEKKEK